jgi:toxin CptA
MHSAPSVTYPVGRSRGATRILIATWALGAACAGLSCYLFDSAGWRQLLLVLSVLLSGLAAGLGLRSDGAGVLNFDGLGWTLTGAHPGRAVHAARAAVALDLQSLLLVRLTQPGRASRWIWVEQRAMPERWRDLRRAVYSRAPSASPAGEPWRATAPADAP